jgi:predicted aspartyl protease
MNLFHVDCTVENVRKPRNVTGVKRLMVDSGAEYTWIPEDILETIGVQVAKKDIQFLMANGQTITRDIGYAIIRVDEFETVDEVVFGKKGDLKLLGARTLEGFAARVDSREKKLVAAGPIPAA